MSFAPNVALGPADPQGSALFWVALFVLSVSCSTPGRVTPACLGGRGCDSFAIYTTTADGEPVNANHYDSKPEVYLNGGPDSRRTPSPRAPSSTTRSRSRTVRR